MLIPITSSIQRWILTVDSLGPSDAIWRQRSGSSLAQVMACCLMAPTHYLNQCWLCISKVEWHSFKRKFTRDTSAINHEIIWKIKYLNYHSNFPGVNGLIWPYPQSAITWDPFSNQSLHGLLSSACSIFHQRKLRLMTEIESHTAIRNQPEKGRKNSKRKEYKESKLEEQNF